MNRELVDCMMLAGRADGIPVGERGLWHVKKLVAKHPVPNPEPDKPPVPPGQYTFLGRYTDATIRLGRGETVMVDNPIELRKHVGAAMDAYGDVLVTGLGLACVLRMMQQNPRVERITVVEISLDVIDLVWGHTPHDRVDLVHADALEFLETGGRQFDCAWHDVWTDTSNGEPHLAVQHTKMMCAAVRDIGWQRAWDYPRWQQRAFNEMAGRMKGEAVHA